MTVSQQKLEQYSTRIPETGCLWWIGGQIPEGYGQVWDSDRKKVVGAHRAAYELAHGPIPKGLLVRHKCDNPSCIDPDHLEVGTIKDNAHDAMKRGRLSTGAHRYNFKMTDEVLSAIDANPDIASEKLGKMLGVDGSAIRRHRRK